MTTQPVWPQLGNFSHGFNDLDTLIKAFQLCGLTQVQLSEALLEQALAHPDAARAMRATLEQHGISVVALAGYRNIIAPDQTRRQTHLDFLKRCLQIAPILGNPVVATETGTLNPDNDWAATPANQSPAAWQILQSSIAELLPIAEKYGSILALEGYVNNIVSTMDQMSLLLEQFPSPYLQVVLDPFNYLSAALLPQQEQLTSAFLQCFERRFVLAHLKDVSSLGAEIETPEFGYGVFPHRLYLDFLRTHRPDLPLILEHLPWDHVPAAIQRLQLILA